ncbi:MAG: gliding motility-associated C-terminal domain-containing protein [Crocinitomicaceae bacterium]
MRNNILLIVLFSTITQLSLFAQIQCVEDVTIVEGNSIEMCEGALTTISGSGTFVSYGWTGPETLAGQTITPQFSGDYILAAVDGVGCVSSDTITVTINPSPTPTLVSSEGNPICPGGGTTLSTNPTYVSYDWGGGNTGSTFFASAAGSYSVTVVDNKGCSGSGSINITELVFDLDVTSVSGCEGSTSLLTASGGSSYLWSTGETGSSIVVNPGSNTNYSVTISSGSCSTLLSTNVSPSPTLDFELPDTVYLSPGQTEVFSGPDDFSSYSWLPSSQINDSTAQTVVFNGTESQTLTMVATHSSGCVITKNVVIIIVELTIPNGFSPNADYYNDLFVVPELYNLDAKIQVWNRWGDLVLDQDKYLNDWDGTCQTSLCAGNGDLPEGTYFYRIVVEEIEFDGFITLKR